MSSAPGLAHGLKILEILYRERERGFNQLREDLDLSAASLNRYLTILLERGFAEKTEKRRYRLGSFYFSGGGGPSVGPGYPGPREQLGPQEHQGGTEPAVPQAGPPLPDPVLPILKALSAETGATALYIQFVRGLMRCAAKAPHPDGLTMQEPGEVRSDYPLHPWGYLYLASRDPEERRILIGNAVLLEIHRAFSPGPELLRDFIDEAAREGCSDDRGRILLNARRLAVPVHAAGTLIGAVGIGVPGTELPPGTREGILQLMKEKAEALGSVFGPALGRAQ